MFGLVKTTFIRLIAGLFNASNHTKRVQNDQKCEIQPTLINLHPSDYSKELCYYPFMVKLDRCVGNCNTLNDLSNKVFVPNKTEELNLSVLCSALLKE